MSLLQKRKNPETKPKAGVGLAEPDRIVLNVIKSKKEMAILKKDLQKETLLPNPTLNKCLKNLLAFGLIKEVVHVQIKGKFYIAAEFEPSEEITGGSWYADGKLDLDFINKLKDISLQLIRKRKVVTADEVYDIFNKNNLLINTKCTSQQVSEMLKSMVLENMIIDVKSTGLKEYHSIPVGKLCYRCPTGDFGQELETGALMSIPCGVCPRIRECTPDGLISPKTCVYYTKWLDF